MITDIRKFAKQFGACGDGAEWAITNCAEMDDVWQKAKPEWLIWVATRDGVLDDKTLRLFACWSVRQVWHLLSDERSRRAVEVAERFAHGECNETELDAAWAAARAAAWAAAWDAAGDAAWAAVRAAARAAVGAAARAAVRAAAGAAAAGAAAGDAAWAAARAAAWDAAGNTQAAWLRSNVQNPFVKAAEAAGGAKHE